MKRKSFIGATAVTFALAMSGTGLAAAAPQSGKMQSQPQQQTQQAQPTQPGQEQGQPQASRPQRASEDVIGFLDKALQQHPLSAAQKQQISNAVESDLQHAQAQQAQRRDTLNKQLQLFEANKLDENALRRLQTEQMDKASQTVTTIVGSVHAALTPAQRQEVASYIRSHEGQSGFGMW